MAERVDKKLQTVVLARYQYRHEAEFAAGFLDEAGIPYRLQIDDPAMGMTIGTPATLWVRGMDVRAALDTLNVRELPSHRVAAEAAEAAETGEIAETAEVAEVAEADGAATIAQTGDRLTPLERTVAISIFVVLGGTTYLASGGAVWGAAVAALAAPLGLVGLLGRAPSAIRRFLRAISGSAP
jgi:hypothetical protein